MWKLLFSGVAKIFTSWVDMKKSKNEADGKRAMKLAEVEATYDLEAQRNMKGSLKDEFIMIIWYSPLVIGWWDAEEGKMLAAQEWVDFVSQLPTWWSFGAFGIMAATFGLRWYFNQQSFKVGN